MDKTVSAFEVPLDALIERAVGVFVYGASGSGKSTLLRSVLESTHGRIHQIVIDSEGEFHTLRSQFDYLLVGGDGADIPARVDTAAVLAARLMEFGVSAIVDISEISVKQRPLYVEAFLRQLLETPSSQWHPVLVVIDEIKTFAPQSGSSASSAVVSDFQARGRKRGMIPVYATQNFEGVDKEAVSELQNRVLGTIDVDTRRKRAADDFGLNADDRDALKQMPIGQFFVRGPAFGRTPRRVQVQPTLTTKPPFGSAATPPATGSEALQKLLAHFADLPEVAGEEAATLGEARKRVRSLEERVSELQTGADVQRVVEQVAVLSEGDLTRLEGVAESLRIAVADLTAHADIQQEQIAHQQTQVDALREQAKGVAATADQIRAAVRRVRGGTGDDGAVEQALCGAVSFGTNERNATLTPDEEKSVSSHPLGNISALEAFSGGARRLLTVLATYRGIAVPRTIALLLAGIKESGPLGVAIAHFKREGWMVAARNGTWAATPTGRGLIGDAAQENVLRFWETHLSADALRLATVLQDAGHIESLAQSAGAAGLRVASKGWSDAAGQLEKHDLIRISNGRIAVTPLLKPELHNFAGES